MLDIQGVRVRSAGKDGDRLRSAYPLWFRTDGAEVDAEIELESGADEGASLVAFQHRLDALLLERWVEFAPAHAGVVEVDGLLIVLPGPSGCGKSSLVSHLVQRGARYYSDEVALIDAEGRVHAYPRPPKLRDANGRSYLDLGVVATLSRYPGPRRPDVRLFLEHRQATVAAAPGAASV